MAKFKYPPCIINPNTEVPYKRHKWVIPEGATGIIKQLPDGPIVYYRVRCSRCGISDPNPPQH